MRLLHGKLATASKQHAACKPKSTSVINTATTKDSCSAGPAHLQHACRRHRAAAQPLQIGHGKHVAEVDPNEKLQRVADGGFTDATGDTTYQAPAVPF